MGMVCGLHRASDQDIARLIEHPEELRDFLEPYDPNAPEIEEVRPKGLLGLLLRLSPITITQVKPRDDLTPEEMLAGMQPNDDEIDLDKAWHGLHYLFTGSAWEGDEPGCFLVRGGEDVADEEYGYGLVRAFRAGQTRDIASFLASLSRDELARRFDPEDMTKLEIYPDVIWTRTPADDDDPLEYLISAFDDLQTFVSKTANEGDGLLVYLT
jgi:hypothetical protein